MAVALAHALRDAGRDAVVLNADASQVYADLAVLSARPTADEMAGVPHRLFGHVDGAASYSAPHWAAEARDDIDAAHRAGAIPILVGGTGLYLRTLIDGIAPVPAIDPAIRAAVRALPVDRAHAALAVEDPAAAARLHASDTTRVARALEVIRSTGRPLAAWQTQRHGAIGHRIAVHGLVLMPPRDVLRARCDARLVTMFDGGAEGEVHALRARGLSPDAPVMRAIGVPQIMRWLDGEIDRATALDLAQAATRQYAKRQANWFRHQPPPDWQQVTETLNDDAISDLVIKLRQRLLTA